MDSSHNCQNQNSKDIWSAIRSLKNSLNPKLMANKENKTKSTPNMKSDGSLQINSLSFTYEVEQRDSNRDCLNFSHISPHFSRPVDLKKEPLKEIQNLQFSKEKRSVSSNILEKSNQNSGFDELKTSKVSIFDIATQEKIQLEQENYELRQDVTRLQNLLIKTRKENSRQNIKIQEDHKKQLQAQSQNFEDYIKKLQSEFEENLLAKEEELIIMNNLMNNPCETEPMSKFLSFEEQLISKYEKIIKEMKDEFERDFIDLQHNYERELKKNMKEREKLLNEISNQKQEIYQLKLFIPNNKEKAQTYRDSQNSGRLLTQEGKDKVLQNLLFKINKYIDNNSIDNEITPANKKVLYEMVSARGEKKVYSSEYNTISDQRRSTKDYTSREEELVDDEDDMCWLDNSIKNLHVRMHKN